jgi:predicted transglutaminase-like cysteine proteinase
MARGVQTIIPLIFVVASFLASNANARNRLNHDSSPSAPIAEASPTLAPFQHVRFCLRYPSDCKSDPAQHGRIELSAENLELLNRINSDVNAAIAPTVKGYGPDLKDGWSISPTGGDCNDYAVTKRHDLIEQGLPANDLRLSVVKTSSGIGHLVLVVATTKGDLVLDNLTETIRPWQGTDYRWLKIQSATDAKFWYEIKAPVAVSQADERRIRLADR